MLHVLAPADTATAVAPKVWWTPYDVRLGMREEGVINVLTPPSQRALVDVNVMSSGLASCCRHHNAVITVATTVTTWRPQRPTWRSKRALGRQRQR
jgi:hypothetical protein